MRLVAALLALAAIPLAIAPADAQGRGRGREREQDAAFHARQQGRILPLSVILSRIRIRNAEYIGADLDPSGSVYRLTFMGPGGNVVRVHVDARTGDALGVSR